MDTKAQLNPLILLQGGHKPTQKQDEVVLDTDKGVTKSGKVNNGL